MTKIQRVCAHHKIFVKYDGDVYACCLRCEQTKMGNVKDRDIIEKITKGNNPCECHTFKSIPATKKHKPDMKIMNFELGLLCQARCLMCFNEPYDWTEKYTLYDKLEALIDEFRPALIMVQGGEILIQKDAIDWLYKIKQKYPDIKYQIITNGCVSTDKAKIIEELFDIMTFSIIGFEENTYNTMMGLDQKTTFNLIEKLIYNNNTEIKLKFLDLPSTVHESHLFLEWALDKNPAKIYMHSSNLNAYINPNNQDNYWSKIFKITGEKIRKTLIENKEKLKNKDRYISFNSNNAQYYGLTREFLEQNVLDKAVKIT